MFSRVFRLNAFAVGLVAIVLTACSFHPSPLLYPSHRLDFKELKGPYIPRLDQIQYGSVQIRIEEKGGFWKKTLKEMGSSEFAAAVRLACAYFGVDCSTAVAAVGVVARELSKHGEEHRGVIISPAGFVLCDVRYTVYKHDGGTTFNGTYVSTGKQDQLSWYAVVPRRSKKRVVDFKFSLMYVRPAFREVHHCLKPGSQPWLCPHNWYCRDKREYY